MDQTFESGAVKLKVDEDGDVFLIVTDETAHSVLVMKSERADLVRAVAKLGLTLPAHETLMITLDGPRFEDAPLAPPSADEVRTVSDYAAELAHPERSNTERQLGMRLGRVVRDLVRREQRSVELEAELAAEQRDRNATVDRANKLRDLASDLLDAYCGVGAATWQRTWDELTLLCGRVVEPWSGAPTIDELLARAYLAGVSAGHANHGLTSDGYQTLAEAWIAFQRGIAQKYTAIESTPEET
jgi:hypothetical protein